jgi:hypothetical protein
MSYPRRTSTAVPFATNPASATASRGARSKVSCAQIYNQALRDGGEEIDEACRNGWNQQCRAAVGRYMQSTEQQVRETRAAERKARTQVKANEQARLPLEHRVEAHVQKAGAVRERHAKQTQKLAEEGHRLLEEAEARGVNASHPLIQQAVAVQPVSEEESVDLGVGVVIDGALELGIDMDDETQEKLAEVIAYAIRLAYQHRVVETEEALAELAKILASPPVGGQQVYTYASQQN